METTGVSRPLTRGSLTPLDFLRWCAVPGASMTAHFCMPTNPRETVVLLIELHRVLLGPSELREDEVCRPWGTGANLFVIDINQRTHSHSHNHEQRLQDAPVSPPLRLAGRSHPEDVRHRWHSHQVDFPDHADELSHVKAGGSRQPYKYPKRP